MNNYFVIKRSTPEDAPDFMDLDPVAPFGMAFGVPIIFPPRIVATFSSLARMPTAGWLGSYFFMGPKFVERIRLVGETQFIEYRIWVSDMAGRCECDVIKGILTLNNVQCMNKNESDFDVSEYDADDIVTIRRLVLDARKIPEERHLFRVAEFPTALVASNRLVEELTAMNIRGVKFTRPEEYRI